MRPRSLGAFVAGLMFLVPRMTTAQTPAATPAGSPAASAAADPYVWLEDQRGANVMAWVARENARTAGVLENDPHFATLYGDALATAQASDRIPDARFIDGVLYNLWQDSTHVRGIWRRTSLAEYRKASPAWETVLDIDSLARAEKANWFFRGAECAAPAERRCLIALSDGGEDAVTVREFDLGTKQFVPDGFVLPHGKQRYTWVGEDTLLVSREWEPGELTKSGYAYIVKRWIRGRPLSSAVEIFRGAPSDETGAGAETLQDASGRRFTVVDRGVTFFQSEKYVVRGDSVSPLAVPLKAYLVDMVNGQVVVKLSEDWNDGAVHIPAGSLASFDAMAAQHDPAHLSPVVVYTPGPRESVEGTTATRDHLLVTVDQNVRGRVFDFRLGPSGGWTYTRLSLPDNLAIRVGSADWRGEEAFLSVAGFLTPNSVWLANAQSGDVEALKTLSPKFDAAADTVEQLEATSTDGTKIPYFVVHPKQMKLDGANPTILYAYGGFEISETPSYSPMIGKLWLEHGGVYVLANIRGGGEFGPAWHEAGLKTHRQIIYDDFASVARDLIARHITTPRRLGIMGGSNGGLLMGVEMTEHPELWHAVDIQVPLLDMLRYEQIDAGASWVGEYGSVSNPRERAFLEKISPYQNLKAGVQYPEPLIWTTTKDDRVGPQHARKFAAKMSAMGLPYLFYEVTEGGHGAGANLKERAHTSALEYTYFSRMLMQ